MQLKIRMQIHGKKGQRSYSIVVAPVSSPRDGKHIAKLGYYQPWNKNAIGSINADLVLDWIKKGANVTLATSKVLAKLDPKKCGHLYVTPALGEYHGLKKPDVKKAKAVKKAIVEEQKKKALESVKKKKEAKEELKSQAPDLKQNFKGSTSSDTKSEDVAANKSTS